MSDDKSPIRSTLASDPDFVDLVIEFVNEIPGKRKAIQAYMACGDVAQLQRAIHQLRGACGGYGFQSLTNAAAEIEESMKSGNTLEQVESRLNDFLDSLDRMSSDT